MKVPQILKIVGSKSAEGINVYGVYLELFAITANFAYSYVMNFPFRYVCQPIFILNLTKIKNKNRQYINYFSAWGEGTFLAIQTAIIAALVLHFGGTPAKAVAFLTVYVGLVSTLVSGYTPTDVLWNMQAINVPIILIAKVYFSL